MRRSARGDGRTVYDVGGYNGVDPSQFTPGGDPAQPVLLTVGNLIPSKGHELIVHALTSAFPEFPELIWEVIGEGPELDRIRALAEKLGVPDQNPFPAADRIALRSRTRADSIQLWPFADHFPNELRKLRKKRCSMHAQSTRALCWESNFRP